MSLRLCQGCWYVCALSKKRPLACACYLDCCCRKEFQDMLARDEAVLFTCLADLHLQARQCAKLMSVLDDHSIKCSQTLMWKETVDTHGFQEHKQFTVFVLSRIMQHMTDEDSVTKSLMLHWVTLFFYINHTMKTYLTLWHWLNVLLVHRSIALTHHDGGSTLFSERKNTCK